MILPPSISDFIVSHTAGLVRTYTTPIHIPSGETVHSDSYAVDSLPFYTTSGGTWAVTGGRLVQSNGGETVNAFAWTGNPAWVDYSVQAVLRRTAGTQIHLLGRVTDVDNHYILQLNSSGLLQLRKRVASTYTLLDDWSGTFTQDVDYTVKLEMNGTSIKGYVDGVERVSATDSDLTAGMVGFRSYESTAQYDDLLVVSLSATTQPYEVNDRSVNRGKAFYRGSNTGYVAGADGKPGILFTITDGAWEKGNFATNFGANQVGSMGAFVRVKDAAIWTDATFRLILSATYDANNYVRILRVSNNGVIRADIKASSNVVTRNKASLSTTGYFHVGMQWDLDSANTMEFFFNGVSQSGTVSQASDFAGSMERFKIGIGGETDAAGDCGLFVVQYPFIANQMQSAAYWQALAGFLRG